MKLVTTQQMRELEERANASGNSYAEMMERAGTLTAQATVERWRVRGRRVLVLVGPGNNGGDGLVCARVLHDHGASVSLYVWRRVPSVHDQNWELVMQRQIPFTRAEDDTGFAQLKTELKQTNFLVDALLGTGVTRPIEGLLHDLLMVIKEPVGNPAANGMEGTSERALATLDPLKAAPPAPRYKTIAVDLPTGLNPDTGALDPAALAADLTITFAFPKIGQYQFPGAATVGELVVADIGIPDDWATDQEGIVATPPEIRARLPKRKREANKGTFGKVLIACGSLNFTGAPVLAARAAGRSGAGLVTLAVPQTIHPTIAAKIDEATFLPLPDRLGDWRPRAANDLLAYLWDTPYDALLVGCGLGRADSTLEFLQRLLENLHTLEKVPTLVLDADALNLLAGRPEWWTQLTLPAPPIFTPHPGEMARLLGSTTAQVQQDRRGAARDAARQWNVIAVLKGAFTLVAAPNGELTLIPFANPALATAGTGDVLAGTIAGLAAQARAAGDRGGETDPLRQAFNAAITGTYLHALAGELAAAAYGDAGMVAGDLPARLPEAIKRLKEISS